jgi:hypothetical protein
MLEMVPLVPSSSVVGTLQGEDIVMRMTEVAVVAKRMVHAQRGWPGGHVKEIGRAGTLPAVVVLMLSA